MNNHDQLVAVNKNTQFSGTYLSHEMVQIDFEEKMQMETKNNNIDCKFTNVDIDSPGI